MRVAVSKQGRSAIVAAGLAVAWTLTGSAHADVIESSPSFPPIPLSFTSPTGAGCFDLAKVCVTPGTFTLTSAMSTFVPVLLPAVQDITAEATYGATLTPLPSLPPATIGSVSLTGTVKETLGRKSNTETGTFTTDITYLYLTGTLMLPPSNPLDGAMLVATLDLNPSTPSTGTTSITPLGQNSREFLISSSLDIFIDVSVPSFGLSRPGIRIPVVAGTPEPATWAMMLIGFAGLAFAARRRAAARAG